MTQMRKIAIGAGRMTGNIQEKLERIATWQEELRGIIGFVPGLAWEGEFSLKTPPRGVEQIRLLAGDLGVQIASIGAFAFVPPNPCLTDEDPARRQKAIAFVQTQVELARDFGAPTVSVVTTNRSNLDMDPRRLEELAVDSLSSVQVPEGVVIAIEHIHDRFGTSPTRILRLLRALKSPRIGWYFDPANVVAERALGDDDLRLEAGESLEEVSEPAHWLRMLGPPAVVDIKGVDLTREESSVPDGKGQALDLRWEASIRQWTPALWTPNLLEGSIDWPAILKLLNEYDYQGWFTYEGQKSDHSAIAEFWEFANIPLRES